MEDNTTSGAGSMPVISTPALVETVYLLSADAGVRDALTVGQGLPTEILGQPVKHFWIDGIKTGEYHHRDTATTGTLKVTRAGIDKWVENFKKMKANGVPVPTITHHLSQDSRDSMGSVVDMRRDGDTLKVLHQLIGEDAIRMAARNKISLGISNNYIDGHGIKYGEAIVHSALTPSPVVPGMGGFTSLAMRGPTDGPLYELAAPRSSTMPTAEEMAEMRKLPGAESVPEETAFKWLLSQHNALASEHAVATANVDTLLSRATEAETLLGEAQGQVTLLSQNQAVETVHPDDGTLMLLSRAAETEWDGVVRSGAITPAAAKELKSLFRGTDNRPNLIALSHVNGNADPLEFQIAAILKKNKPASSGLVGDVFMSQDPTPRTDTASAQVDPALQQSMVAQANGQNPNVQRVAKMTRDEPKKGATGD